MICDVICKFLFKFLLVIVKLVMIAAAAVISECLTFDWVLSLLFPVLWSCRLSDKKDNWVKQVVVVSCVSLFDLHLLSS